MATYIPGTQTFMPTFQPFTPDYKFLSDVINTKTNRYETNYKAINDTYGRLIHSDLSRLDTQEQRDQYVNELAPRLEQIASTDLSLIQNADQANALFKPFYEDKLIVGDLVRTAALKSETAKAERYHYSDNPEERDLYGNGQGVKRMNYEMQDFINASPEEALNMPIPKFVPNADIHTMSMDLLKNAWGEGKGMTLTQDFLQNGWKIKKTNGDLLTNRVVGYAPTGKKDKNGQEVLQPITENIAAAFVQKELLNDPRVLDSEWTKAYVSSREAADRGVTVNGQTVYGDEAKRAWALERINFAKAANSKRVAMATVHQNKTVTNGKDWQSYKEEYGIVKESPEEVEFLKTIMELEAANQEVETAEEVANVSENINPENTDLKGLLNEAYGIVISSNLMGEISDASILYAATTSQMEMEIDQKWKLYKQQEFDLQKININHRNTISEIRERGIVDDAVNKAKFEREQAEEKKNKSWLQKLEDLVQGTSYDGDGKNFKFNTDADGNPDPNANIVMQDETSTWDTYMGPDGIIPKEKFEAIKAFMQERSALAEDGNQAIAKWGIHEMSWDNAQKHLMNPDNRGELNGLYDWIAKEVKHVGKQGYAQLPDETTKQYGYMPKMARSNNFPAIRNMFEKASGHEQMLADGGWKKMINDYGNMKANAGVKINNKPSLIDTYEKSGLPSPYISPFEQNLFNAVYDANGIYTYTDKTGTKHELDKRSGNLGNDIAKIYGINVGQLKKDDQDVPLVNWEAIEYTKNLIPQKHWDALADKSPLTEKYIKQSSSGSSMGSPLMMGTGGSGGFNAGSEVAYRWPTDRAGGSKSSVYASYRHAINKPYISAFAGAQSKDGTPLEQPIFDLGQYMQGNSASDMSAVGGAKYPIHTQYIDPLNLEEKDITMMGEVMKILNGPNAKYSVGFGTPGEYKYIASDASDEAKNAVISTINNVIKDAKAGTKAQGRNTFQIKYHTGYGVGDADKRAAYQIQVSKKDALALQKYLTGETSGLITDSEKQLVTIMFDKDLDNNPLGMPDTRFSKVDYNIQRNDGVYDWNIPNGPGLRIWKEDGMYMRSFKKPIFNTKTGTIQLDPNVGQGRAMPITYSNGAPLQKKDLDIWLNNWQSGAMAYQQSNVLIPQQTWKKQNPNKMVTYDIPKYLLSPSTRINTSLPQAASVDGGTVTSISPNYVNPQPNNAPESGSYEEFKDGFDEFISFQW